MPAASVVCGSRALSEPAVDVGAAADPVAAVLEAHAAGRPLALRTSGTTGRPRVVVRSTRSWFDSFPAVAELTGLSARSRVWLPGPMTSTMNLFAAVLTRAAGASAVATPQDATHAHLTPYSLARALDAGVALAGVHLTVAGDRLSASLYRRALGAGAAVSHYYGAAELSFVGWGTYDADLAAFPGVEVEARSGVLWVRSPFLCSGYADAADAGLPPGPLRRDGTGFATVGDRGSVSDGRLVVRGRGSAAVTTGGATVHVADVEDALRDAVSGEVVVVGRPHEVLGEVVAAVLTDPTDEAAARAAALDRLAPAQRPRLWFAVPALPLTGAGKVDRFALHALLESPGQARVSGSARHGDDPPGLRGATRP